ncbi:MAG: hypothetical protein WC679_02545 [Bacteroidales bacterium]|jgi:adenylylsulfate kinase-like enzyme
MGAAAYHRGSKVIANQIQADYGFDKKQLSDQIQRMSTMAEEFNQYATKVLDFIVEPRGLCRTTVEHQKTKNKFKKLMELCITCDNEWVDANSTDAIEWLRVSKARAKARHSALVYVMQSWNIEHYIGTIPGAFR